MTVLGPEDVDPRQIFNDSWDSYTQLLASNGLFHREQYDNLREFLQRSFFRPFSLLDLGCGDAGNLCKRLTVDGSLPVDRYVGVDLSKEALDRAQRRLPTVVASGTPMTFHQTGMLEFLQQSSDSFAVVMASFALHHLSPADKGAVVREAFRLLKSRGGVFIIVDTFLSPRESRDSALDRFNAYFNAQPQMTPAAKKLLCAHVRECDFPETVATYEEFAKQAGYASVEVIYTDPQQMGSLMVMHSAAKQQS